MLIDGHCHLSSRAFSDDLDEVVRRAKDAGVERFVVPSTNLKDARRVLEITQEYGGVFGLAGLYPGEAQKSNHWEKDFAEIVSLVTSESTMVGIGEIGLDAYWNGRGLALEQRVFTEQLRTAASLDLPVAIHNRNAEREIISVLDTLERAPRGHFHCWSGSRQFLDFVLAHGFYVGFCGNVTYTANAELRELASNVPLDRLLLETDSPYLPPQGKRGERNEPGNVTMIATVLAGAQGVEPKVLIQQTGENARELYGL